ncbi:mitochondrial translation release factor in rescue [Drosophila grimshawi]|uniref:GH22113 n=1 Tax=Drosophila grimshawi TaxID=7222 RepID=B4J465_DROGR|nr:mitochondrial translation release factor in rescue [Drosophila grimshawi]EDW02671.1 GH22113 [Drosophila grimshawi]
MLQLRSLAAVLSSSLCHRLASNNAHLDYSRYPSLQESDIEETLMRGSGPGGQAVNKTNNCVFLRHLPTGLTVKCHLHRLASKNRIEARKILLDKLDAHLNGEQSIAAQLKVFDQKKSSERKRRQGKLQEMKKMWQSREMSNVDGETEK